MARIGPYEVLQELGQGGMGRVALGEHVTTGERVAVKTVRVQEAWLLASIRREIHALERVRHPGVACIKDHGLQDGIPWYAMELVAGLPLRAVAGGGHHSSRDVTSGTERVAPAPAAAEATARAATVYASATAAGTAGGNVQTAPPSAASRTLRRQWTFTVMRRLSETLAYLHGEGIVHRDLKPDNVIVRPDGMPVLVDFGLVTTIDPSLWRESLDVSADGSGTFAYMAPEQGLRRPVDARADLYALGCILYELLTGRTPFYGATVQELLEKHQRMAPVAPSRIASDIPPELDALCLALLAKAPRDRIGHADIVAARLAALSTEATGDEGRWGPPPRAYLYRPGLAGRDDDLQRLVRALDPLGSPGSLPHGRRALVVGESGAGKTRLLMSVAAEAHRRRIPVVACDCLPPSPTGAPPLSAFANLFQVIADRCRELGLAQTERLLGKRGRVLAPYHPALLELPGQEKHPDPADLPAEAARRRVVAAVTATAEALADPSGLCLVVDDLQWADPLSLDAIEQIGAAGRSSRVLVIGSVRTEEQSDAMARLRSSDDVVLGRLDAPAVRQMVGDMLGAASPPEPLLSFLGDVAEGNPFFVAEYLRTAVQEGILGRDAAGHWTLVSEGDPSGLRVPTALRGLVAHRLSGLSPLAARIADVAATIGREVDLGVLRAATSLPERDLLDGLADLVSRQIMEDAADGKMRFLHDKLHEVAYARLPDAAKREIHRAVAQALEDQGGDLDQRRSALGHHWMAAGDDARAEAHLLAGARDAARRHATRAAEAMFRAVLALPRPPSLERAQARQELAAGLFVSSRLAESEAQLLEAIAEARALGDRELERRCLRSLALVEVLMGRVDEACAHVDLLRSLVPSEPRQRAETLSGLALALQYVNRTSEAIDAYHEAEQLLAGDPAAERALLTVRLNLGSCLMTVGRNDESLAVLESIRPLADRTEDRNLIAFHRLSLARVGEGPLEVVAAKVRECAASFRELEHTYYEAMTLGILGETLLHLGAWDEAQDSLETALAQNRELGNVLDASHELQKLGLLAQHRGDLPRAVALQEEAMASIVRSADNRAVANIAAYLVDALAAAGRADDARRVHGEAVAAAARIPDDAVRAIADLHLGALERREGNLALAAELLARADPALRRSRDRPLLARFECELGQLALARGDVASARDNLERARRLAGELGAWPGSFLVEQAAALEAALAARACR